MVKPILSSALVDCMNELLGNPHGGQESDETNEFASKTLLLAEDIEINREIVISLLEGTGIAIECAVNGKEALDRMQTGSEKYDLVFMDVQMPVMDGLEATRRIRALPDPRCQEIPIIAMTANVFRDDIENCLAAGMNGHIGKPIHLDDMLSQLHKYLEGVASPPHKAQGSLLDLALLRGSDEHIAALEEGTKVSVDIRVVNERGKRETLSLPSVVEEVYPDGFFLVRMPTHQGEYYPIPREEMLLIYFTVVRRAGKSPDMFVIPARFVEKIERSSTVYAKVEPLGKVERSQRRDCYRLPLSTSVFLRRNPAIDEMPHDAEMVNISDGGMLISTDENLEKDERVTLEFTLGGKEAVEGVVLRVERAGRGDRKFRAAIQFENASAEQKERFYQYIVSRQMDKRLLVRDTARGFTGA
jgi:CheY-like chemotaxis protein/c-di-GMP-binding flagellar brake protein YcgR